MYIYALDINTLCKKMQVFFIIRENPQNPFLYILEFDIYKKTFPNSFEPELLFPQKSSMIFVT